ncbi:carbohydrate ABC transporter permease [Paenibacillus sp. PAMC21692]|uniref:carbohydrate ABC transporter permease n=1 Tax=Paenibacillus sp. PAMC21692 TaxID=2762320 RepID=UPI00164EC6F7|nr:carbohydrate ABC transporter permease [Paenibacillus sp. PAMC21692]QNK58436.1 carbohydrate ABC transporter permease [Paenibacillus sp. PAMC21692]
MNKKSRVDWFDVVNYSLIVLCCMAMIYPIINVLAVSLSSYSAYIENPMRIWPKHINFASYQEIFSKPLLWSSYLNTIIVTAAGVVIGTFLYIITAYPLSKGHLKGRKVFMIFVVFTMLFNGGIIPNFYLMRAFGLVDTLAALVLPLLFSGFSLILMKTFMENIPEELEEAAKIDGASEPYLLFRIVVPLSKPIIATLCLFSAVAYWNNYFNAVLYIRSAENWPLMLFLKEMISNVTSNKLNNNGNLAELGHLQVTPETLQYATIMIVMVPILSIYPFVQKYFVKGIMLGSVKG